MGHWKDAAHRLGSASNWRFAWCLGLASGGIFFLKAPFPSLDSPVGLAVLWVELVLAKVLLFRLTRDRSGLRFLNVAGLFVFGLLLLHLGGRFLAGTLEYAAHAARAVADPLARNPMEGREVVKAALLGHGVNIYPSLSDHPALVTIYPPLYHAVTALAGLWGQVGIGWARAVSMAGLWLCALWLGHVTRLKSGSVLAGAGVVLLAALDPTLGEWSRQARPDMPAWALAFLGGGLYWTAVPDDPGGRIRLGRVALAGVVLCLGVFAKQQTLPVFLALAAWSLGLGRRGLKPLAVLTACLALPGLILTGALEWSSGGNFVRDTILYPLRMGTASGLSAGEFLLARLIQFKDLFWGTLLMAGACLALAVRRRAFLAPLFLVVVNALFMAKLSASWGADVNYGFGVVFACLLATGLVLGLLDTARPYGRPVLFLVLFCLLPAQPSIRDAWADFLSGPALDGKRLDTVRTLRGLTGHILANTEGGQTLLGASPGRRVTFFDGIETMLFEKAGLWNCRESALAEDIRARRFDALVLHGDFLPRAVADAAGLYYDRREAAGHYAVHVPKAWDFVLTLDEDGQARADAGVSLACAGLPELNRETEGLAPLDRSRPARIVCTVLSRSPVARIEAAFGLRLDPRDPASTATWSVLDASGVEIASGSARADSAGPGVLRPKVEARPGVGRFQVVVTLTGNAWLCPERGALVLIQGRGEPLS